MESTIITGRDLPQLDGEAKCISESPKPLSSLSLGPIIRIDEDGEEFDLGAS